MQYKIYPSSYALPVGPTVDTTYNSGCLRYIKFKSYLPRDFEFKLPELNSAIGALGEERVRQLLRDRYEADEILIEESFQQDLGDAVIVSGRADFVIKCDDLIVEVKTTKSAAVRSKVINKGELPTSYLGQLLTYMTAFELSRGEIVVQYLHLAKNLGNLGFVDRTFHVEIRGEDIYIDDNKYEHDMPHMLRFYNLAKTALVEDVVPPRPIKDNPCYFCPFQSICNNAQPPATTAEFKEKIRELTPDYSRQIKAPTLPRHDIRKKKD